MAFPQQAAVSFMTHAERTFYIKYASTPQYKTEFNATLTDRVDPTPIEPDDRTIQRSFADAQTAQLWFDLVRKHAPLAGTRIDNCTLL